MTRKERLFAAFRRQPVDRVPFATYNLHPFSQAHRQDPSYAGLLELVWERAGMLCKTELAPLRAPDAPDLADRLEIRSEGSGGGRRTVSILHTPAGDLRAVTEQPPGQPSMVTEHFLKTDADIRTYMSLPFAPVPFAPEPAARLDRDLAGRGVAYVGYGDPLYAAASLFDFADFAVRCVTDPRPVIRLIDFHFERLQVTLQNMLEACRGRDFLFYTAGPELCTPPMLPPALFARLVTPYQRRLIRMIHDAGLLASIHCHGRVRDILPEVIAMEADVLEPLEPPPQGDMALPELLQRVGGRLCLLGYIQDQEFHGAPPGTMRRRVEEIARQVERGVPFVMAPTCTPFAHPASESFRRNYTEWVEAAVEVFGGS